MTRALLLTLLFALDQPTGELVGKVALCGQALELADSPSERITPPKQVPPGAPPLLGFRTIEGRLRHRFGDLDLVMDDAGH